MQDMTIVIRAILRLFLSTADNLCYYQSPFRVWLSLALVLALWTN